MVVLVLLPSAINPAGVLAIEPLKSSLLRGCAALLAGSWLFYRLSGNARVDVGAHPVVRAGLALVLLAAVSTGLSLEPELSFFGGFDRGMGWLSIAAGVVLLVASADLLTDKNRRERAVTALLIGAILPCGYFLLQSIGFDPINWAGRGSPGSTLGSPTFLGGYLVLVAPFAAYRVLVNARETLSGGRSFAYAGWLALLLVIGAVILLSTIRAPLLGLLAGLIAFGVLVRGPRRIRRVEIGVAAAVLIVAVGAATAGGIKTLQRFSTIGGAIDSSTQRLVVWQDSVEALLGNPPRLLVGFGDETQPAIFEHREATMRTTPVELWDRAHNLLLDTWLSHGLIGVTALIVVIGLALRSAWRGRRDEPILAAAVIAGLVGHLVEVSFAFHTVVTGTLFWFLLGMAASLTPRLSAECARRNVRLGCAAASAAVLLVPLMFAPAIADWLYGAARRSNFEVGAQLEEQAAAWAPWVEELPRAAGLDWQQVAIRRNDPGAARRAERDLVKAARVSPLAPVPQIRLTRLYLSHAQPEKAEAACEQAIVNGPYRAAVWDACADVSTAQGHADEAAARKARADAVRFPEGVS